ncbi:Rtn1p [Lachancea thermotolerans CBS 6340]|uniref:Reticulon-like protein n=1 Tax=Lachancea thermotolerans (strain ATCC 56472 / CBS 6340 / NRRL Y-8284) TaxID=559295 RepID=C5DI87_LACTC|nr:KLTH0E10560p [Lachancea thermotolerans CBS 6340]CAR23498.1 KLTH0E10560p [Lachancea thermotolerans CBS 6340]
MSSNELLYWRNPVETGKVFGGILVSLLVMKKVNLITCLLKVMYTIMLTTASVEFLSKLFLGQGMVTKYGLQSCPDAVGFLKPRIEAALNAIPPRQAQLRKLVMAQSPKCTFKAAGILYVLHKLFSVVSLWTALFVGTILTFSLPLIYKSYQKEIDATVAQGVEAGKQHASALQSTVCEKASPYVKQLDEKLGPVSGFVKSKLPATRVGGSNITAESTTTKLAADVPFEKPAPAKTSASAFPAATSHIPTETPLASADAASAPATAKTSSADFPSVPSTDFSKIQATEQINETVKDATTGISHSTDPLKEL